MAVSNAREKQMHRRTDSVLRDGLNELVSMNPEFDGVDVRVFLYLNEKLNFDTPVHLPQIQLSVMLGRRQTHISRSLRKLVAAGVLIPGPNGTRASEWMLNKDYEA